tara:strand:- start:8627 stop:9616 length:990 start_codon:yes stop_codon:yes gene_type:complete
MFNEVLILSKKPCFVYTGGMSQIVQKSRASKVKRKPSWIKVRPPAGPDYNYLKEQTARLGLATVCQEARCPNIGECWSDRTLTIMIMGDTCTRFCKFCNVKTGKGSGWLDSSEPLKTAQLLKPLKLHYVVVTSVDRDDIEDGGSAHFAETIRQIKRLNPETTLEVLTGDFAGVSAHMDKVISARPNVISHNLETVERLTPSVRDRRATYQQSLSQLERVKEMDPGIYTKSSLMLGFGEEMEELKRSMQDLRGIGVDFVTLGQYLRPSSRHHEVKKFYHPDEFEELKQLGYNLGFKMVAAGPLVRSSYKAGEFFIKEFIQKDSQRRQRTA